MLSKIIKRSGEVVAFEPQKLNKWAHWGCEGLDVDWSEIALSAVKEIPDHATTRQLQLALVRACVARFDESPDYEIVAARLKLADVRKEVFGSFTPPSLANFYGEMVRRGLWDDMGYDAITLNIIEKHIDHSRDDLLKYSALQQFCDKYAVKNRVTNRIYETPQFLFMGVALWAMRGEPLEDVIDTYHMLSKQQVNLPTPYLVGMRSPYRGFASCCVISGGDSVPSLAVAEHIAYMMVANRAGIGVELMTRSIKDPVKGGLIEHLGKLPYYRTVDTGVKANSQQARGGSATVHYTILDPQAEDLIRLKSQRVSVQSSIPFMDYSIGVNDFFLRKAARREQWMLVSLYYAPKLWELLYSDDLDAFIAEYERVEADESIPKKHIDAMKLLMLGYTERSETGRIYFHRLDELNRHTPFKDPIRSSNLCQEIALPTKDFTGMKELYSDRDDDGEIALCFLASIVAGRVSEEEYPRVSYLLLKLIDRAIEEADYPFESMAVTAKKRRSVGVGITNLAHYVASSGLRLDSEEARNLIHEHAERQSYWLHKASLQLAKEKGKCEWAHKTKYAEGWVPTHTYCKEVDNHHSARNKYDWENLSREIAANGGLRHSVLEAIAPTESSSVFSCTTNGIDPIRQRKVFKSSRSGDIPFIVPDYDKLKDLYVTAWDLDNKDYAKIVAIIQKFTGQAISYNEYYDYNKYPNKKLPMKDLLGNFFFAAKLGIKTFYYLVSEIGDNESVNAVKETECESCQV